MGLNATLTSSIYNNPIRAHHIGTNYAIGTINTSARTLSDIILLCRVPNGCTIVEATVYGAGAGTAAVLKVGHKGAAGAGGKTAGADNSIIASLDLATGAGQRGTKFVRVDVSLSDTDAQAGADVYATVVSGTWTVSVSFDFQIGWVMKGNGV